jgi:hypothetical protein
MLPETRAVYALGRVLPADISVTDCCERRHAKVQAQHVSALNI